MGDGPVYAGPTQELEVPANLLDETDQARLHGMWFGSSQGDEEKLGMIWDAINRLIGARHDANLNRLVWHRDEGFPEPLWVNEIKADGGHFLAICPDCNRDFIPSNESYYGLNFAGGPLYQHWGYEDHRGWHECRRLSILETFWAAAREKGTNIQALEQWHLQFWKNRATGVWRKVVPSDDSA